MLFWAKVVKGLMRFQVLVESYNSTAKTKKSNLKALYKEISIGLAADILPVNN